MRLPRIHLTKEHWIRTYATFNAVMYRLIPVIIFGLLFVQVAVLIDQAHYRDAPATNFLQYTDFTVQNARVGEDVYFKVCRTHISPIDYKGDLDIYVIQNPDTKAEKKIKVYGRDIAGTINNDCENKVLLASDFNHGVGTYEMTFCVNFTVKYGYNKELCKTSNRYRIYPQPTDLQSQITSLEQQLQTAQQQLQDAQTDGATDDQSLDVPSKTTTTAPSTQSAPTTGSTAPTGTNSGGTSGNGVQPPTCAVNIGSLGLGCGSGGILKL